MGCKQSRLMEKEILGLIETGIIIPDDSSSQPLMMREERSNQERDDNCTTSTNDDTTTSTNQEKKKTTNDDDAISKFLMETQGSGIFIEIFQWLDVRDLVHCSQVSKGFRDLLSHKHGDDDDDTASSSRRSKNFLWFLLYCSRYRSQFAPPPTFEELVHKATAATVTTTSNNSNGTSTTSSPSSSEENLKLLNDVNGDIQWKQLVIQREKSSRSFFLFSGGREEEQINKDAVKASTKLRVAPSSSLWASPPPQRAIVTTTRQDIASSVPKRYPAPTRTPTTATTTTADNISSSSNRLDCMLNVLHKCPAMLQFGHPSCLVLQRHVRDMALQFAGGGSKRKIAYVELYIRGGASCGLVSRNWDREYDTPYHGDGQATQHNCHVGWLPNSIGYHGDSGDVYCCSDDEDDGHSFGPTFGFDPDLVQENNLNHAPVQSDVIGMGVDLCSDDELGNNTLFYTKNGKLVGTISIAGDEEDRSQQEDVGYYGGGHSFANETYCYFAVCLHDRDDFCSINFGTRRFVFDIEKYSQLPPPDKPTLQL